MAKITKILRGGIGSRSRLAHPRSLGFLRSLTVRDVGCQTVGFGPLRAVVWCAGAAWCGAPEVR
jgi:hypothetical protein